MPENQSTFELDLSGTYLFISFDLVNSTAFKLKDSAWPPLFNQFFDYCRLKTKQYFPSAVDWKMVGDEILFYLPVPHVSIIADAPSRVYQIMHSCIDFLNERAQTKGILSVKSILWSAYMKEQRHFGKALAGSNYLMKEVRGGEVVLDFLGPDIDTGFRTGSLSMQGKLVVGAPLAALLRENEITKGEKHYEKNFRIVTFAQLKGVWSGRHYPIIWYHESWDSLETMFVYDEPFVSEMVARIIAQKIPDSPNIDQIHKVFSDLHKTHELDELRAGMEEYYRNNGENEIIHAISKEQLSEVHLVAMCINEHHEMLILSRSDGKYAHWDFGCSWLHMYQSIEDSLEQGYGDDVGVSLQRINGEYPPIATYSYFRDNQKKTIPGIMFLAFVSKDSVKLSNFDQFKYNDYQWVSETSYRSIAETAAVPGFYERIEKAFAEFRKISQ